MANLFNAVKRISDDDLRTEIAMLRCVSISNAAAQTGKRVIGKLANLANLIVSPGSPDGDGRFDYQVITISDMIEEQIKTMSSMNRSELDERFMNELYDKCRAVDASIIPEAMDTETLSVWMTREAARMFSIGMNISPANMCVAVNEKYNDRLLMRLHKMLAAQTANEAKETDMRIQASLNSVPIDVMRSLARQINPPEFSGIGIGKVIRKENGTYKLSCVVTAMGFEPFDEISLRVAAVFDMMASFNRIPRVLIAELIWLAVRSYGKKMTFATDLLPSFVQGTSIKNADGEEKDYWLSLNRRRDFLKRLDEQSKEERSISEKLGKAKSQYLEALDNKKEAELEWKKLESQKTYYTSPSSDKSKDEIRRYYADVTRASRNKEWAEESLLRAEQQMDGLGNRLIEKRGVISGMKEEFIDLRNRTDAMIARRSRELALQWKAYFFRFRFDEIVFSTAVTTFTRSELLKLEEYLKEMHDSRNPDAYSLWTEEEEQDGKVTKYNGIKCLVSSGKDAKVLYLGTYIRKIWA